MPYPKRTGRCRRVLLPLALIAAGILGADGATAPVNAQYPYYSDPYYAYYYPSYYYPGYYPYYYPYAAPYYGAPVAAAAIGTGLALGAWNWGGGWGRPWGWGYGWRGGWGMRLARRLGHAAGAAAVGMGAVGGRRLGRRRLEWGRLAWRRRWMEGRRRASLIRGGPHLDTVSRTMSRRAASGLCRGNSRRRRSDPQPHGKELQPCGGFMHRRREIRRGCVILHGR